MLSAFSMTWLLVSTSPELEITIPVPAPSPPPSIVVTMFTRPGATLDATPLTLPWSLGGVNEPAPEGRKTRPLFDAEEPESLEKSEPPRAELPTSAPPASSINTTAMAATDRRHVDGLCGGGAGGGHEGRPKV